MSENIFQALANEKKSKSSSSGKVEEATVELLNTTTADAIPEDANWTPAVTAKTRRLVPQSSQARSQETLSTAASGLSSPTTGLNKAAQDNAVKKKVIRFTKEEMLGGRKPSRMLASMSDMLEVCSVTALDPVCFEKLDPEDVIRIWNSAGGGHHANGKGGEAVGRGRGRGRKDDNENDGQPADWSRGQPQSSHLQRSGKPGMWDDVGTKGSGGSTFDLADFAAAAQKFGDEMRSMKLTEEDMAAQALEPEDMMTRLLREQTGVKGVTGAGDDDDFGGLLQDEGIGGDDDGDEMPSWADDDDDVELLSEEKVEALFNKEKASMESSGAKRSLLMSTLNMKPAVPAVPRVVEWFYSDSQQQIQGPFSMENMYQWNADGYFEEDLPLRMGHWPEGAFYPFFMIFPDPRNAPPFTMVPNEPQNPAQLAQSRAMAQAAAQAAALVEQQQQQLLLQQRQLAEMQQAQEAQAAEQRKREEELRQQQRLLQQQQQELLLQQQQQQSLIEQQKQRMEQERQQQEQEQRALAQQQQQQQQRLQQQQQLQHAQLLQQQQAQQMSSQQQQNLQQRQQQQHQLEQVQMQQQQQQQQQLLQQQQQAKHRAAQEQQQQQQQRAQQKAQQQQAQQQAEQKAQQQPKAEKPPAAATPAPWANAAASNAVQGADLVSIQNAQQQKSLQEKQAREAQKQSEQIIKSGTGWGNNNSSAAGTASLSQIQEQEELLRQQKVRTQQQQQQQQAATTMGSSSPVTAPAGNNAGSLQLKSLLGLGSKGGAAQPTAGWGADKSPAATTGSASLRDIMSQEASKQVKPDSAVGAGASAKGSATQAKSSQPKAPTSWASKASSGANPLNGPTAIVTAPGSQRAGAPVPPISPAPQLVAPSTPVPPAASVSKQQQQVKAATSKAAPAKTTTAAAPKPVEQSGSEVFGGQEMSKDMADWCAIQLKRINGSEDLTLLQFCMSLSSAVEIREYISEYMGSSAEITNFASDFIKFKDGGMKALLGDSKPKQSSSEFVSATKKKKGGK